MDALSNSSLEHITLEEHIAEEAQKNIASMLLLTRALMTPSWVNNRHR
jgi:hypothetical protein